MHCASGAPNGRTGHSTNLQTAPDGKSLQNHNLETGRTAVDTIPDLGWDVLCSARPVMGRGLICGFGRSGALSVVFGSHRGVEQLGSSLGS